jgi:RNA polymerase sigma-70 factor, ECF subfamily
MAPTDRSEKNVQRPRDSTQAQRTDDLALVHASKLGDVAAFEQLVGRYDARLHRIAWRLTRNHEDSKDVVQEALLKAFQHLGQFREDSKFSTWLVRITLNQSFMKLRNSRTTKEVSFDFDSSSEENNPIDFVDERPNPEEVYKETELRWTLKEKLRELEPGLRTTFIMRYMDGLSLNQTAEALHLNLSAVKTRCRRARLKLRELIEVTGLD